ncbi:hypothetical protein [Streptomyces sp. NPDC002644]
MADYEPVNAEDIKTLEKLAKRKRTRTNFESIQEWTADFEENTYCAISEAYENTGGLDNLSEALDAMEGVADTGYLPEAVREALTALRDASSTVSEATDKLGSVTEAWDRIEEAISELGPMFEEPREYEVDDKDAAWDELTDALTSLANALSELSSG